MAPARHLVARLGLAGGLAAAAVAAGLAQGGHAAGATAQARGDAACQASGTRAGIGLDGRVRVDPRAPRLLGEAPILAGPFWGPRAALYVSPLFSSKFYYLLDPAGPARATVIVRRLDAPGRGLFEVHRPDGTGRVVRGFVRVLTLDMGRIRREQPPRRGDRWLGQPGSILLPALGCYRLQVGWSGGGWSRTFRATPDPRLTVR